MGSRDLQPEGLIGAIENMLPDGGRRSFFYLSIDFLRDEPVTPKQEIYQQTIEERTQTCARSRARQREPEPDARREHHGALPLGRRLGRDHDRQEPGDDAVRPARLPHQGQPEVRLGEEGPADDLLPVGGAGTDPRQLRVLLRRRGALARPQRVPAHQRARRSEGRRRVHHPERPRRRPSEVWETIPPRSSRSSSRRTSGSSSSTPSRSRARRRPTPTCSCACRASPSRARSSRRRR